MLNPEIHEKHQILLNACESGDTNIVQKYLKENAGQIYNDSGVAYEAARIATKSDKVEIYKQLIEFHEPCIYAAQSANNFEKLSENNECLKLSNLKVKQFEKDLKISHTFENFKIMGQMALGLTALAVADLVKVGATLVSEFGGANAILQINKLREKAFPDKTNINKPDW